ncbi:putative DNA-binding protein [Lacticigenium naphthae]|uniref:putative DNA-binding protein n=1 Tax=Lacticigenium naphthae TaxID=515351 RepID=UPI000424CEEA|nr:putative DNA-binding protein [Lacticigenium naphthae]
MELEKTNHMNTLFEFYGSLLTIKQQAYMQLYYADDFSLGEIAEDFQVSRQAIYDNIKRTEVILEAYESKLRLVEEFNKNNRRIQQLKDYIDLHYSTDERLVELANQLLKK